ncbi:curli-like amyloid fiber formation chaperone CsgH [Devosia sp. XK-2]|uniref:curli-like amyloid fiber formation chaperone CsgH n=1 Tax=Devosia sp. XK-2 TaxID=3126689 RepID=UPI0030D126CD
MVHSTFRIGILALGALALAGAAAHATSNDGGLSCGVTTQTERGMMAIEGVVQSPTALTGEYRFALKSQGNGGSTNINQGGQFSVAPGAPVSLGKVMVNAGSAIDVDFTISADGKRLDCSAPLATLT